jgi:hypothetical protein
LTGVVSEENQTIIKTYKMSVPPLKDFFKPILIFMSDGELHTNKELREKVIKYFRLVEFEIFNNLLSQFLIGMEFSIGHKNQNRFEKIF